MAAPAIKSVPIYHREPLGRSMKIKLPIVDFDGTIADTYPVLADSLNVLAARHGFSTGCGGPAAHAPRPECS
ncbi:hypothetical protein D3C81_1931600 [compost metagenome]